MAGIRAGRVTVEFSEDELTDLEAGIDVSGSGRNLFLEQLNQPKSAVLVKGFGGGRNFYGKSGSVGRFFYDPRCEDKGIRGYFLDACTLCKKSLVAHRDIFMYRGDTPFCSEECRQDQIEMDEAKEKMLRNVAVKASSRNESKTNTAQGIIHVHAVGATVAG
ncbi:hypothetical protein ZOSMA_42G01300 [Zostera marina]|uniref:FLZ-type domain-containing protein n=1 Tax=Zostera marina TaxID=29655 RepID=A0A0K9P4H3_ZOSMR|nr:hypothetical protein ZOSMA_42G01300 [Zostera marina]